MKKITLFLLLIVAYVQAAPDNVVRLEGISIQGNSEEPQVIYITPWQEPPGTKGLYQGPYSDKEQWLNTLDEKRLNYEMDRASQLLNPNKKEQ